MQFNNDFTVPADAATTWAILLDVERIVPCVPGAELVEIVDESTWKGKMIVKLGPIRLAFAGEVHLEEADQSAGRVLMQAKGKETRGKGSAQATVSSVLTEIDGGTTVAISADLKLSGPLAQYGRGMVQDVSARMIEQFAQCLASQLTADPEAARESQNETQKPVKGLTLILGAMVRVLMRRLRRLFGRDEAVKDH